MTNDFEVLTTYEIRHADGWGYRIVDTEEGAVKLVYFEKHEDRVDVDELGNIYWPALKLLGEAMIKKAKELEEKNG